MSLPCAFFECARSLHFTLLLTRTLCDYSDAYILVSATITVPSTAATGAAANNNKNMIIKNCAPFTNCTGKKNNTQIDITKDIGIVMHMYNLIECSGGLWHCYRDEPFLDNGAIAGFPANNNNSALFKFKTKIAGKTGNDGTKSVTIRLSLKYLSNFWRTLEMPLINCGINLILSWSNRCFMIDNHIDNQEPTFTITDRKFYVPTVTLSCQDNAELL